MKLFLTYVLCAIFHLETFAQSPALPLNSNQIDADYLTLMSLIETQYSGLSLKSKFKPLSWEQVKEIYNKKIEEVKKVAPDKRNESFTRTMTQLVAEFKDAHFGLNVLPSELPGLSSIQTLGFMGVRHGDDFLVTNLSFLAPKNLSIKKGDIITHIEHLGENGHAKITLKEYFNTYLKPYVSLGSDESTYSYAINMIFNRTSLLAPDASEQGKEVNLYVASEGGTQVRKLSWVEEDHANLKLKMKLVDGKMSLYDKAGKELFLKNHLGQNINLDELSGTDAKALRNDFRFKRFDWSLLSTSKSNPSLEDNLQNILSGFNQVKPEKTFKTKVIDIEGVKVGHIKIDTFLPKKIQGAPLGMMAAVENQILQEVYDSLDEFHSQGIRRVVIDTADNMGGLVSLTVKLAQLLSEEELPSMMVNFPTTSDKWIQRFEAVAREAERMAVETEALERWKDVIVPQGEDGQKEAKIIADELKGSGALFKEAYMDFVNRYVGDFKKNKKLTEKVPLNILFDPLLNAKSYLKYPKIKDFQLVVTTSELNMSGGDIFPAIMKMNKKALLIGAQTVGAGGSVERYSPLQNSRIQVSMTNSLIYYPDSAGGAAIENNGVMPDIRISPKELSKQRISEVKMEKLVFQSASLLAGANSDEWRQYIENPKLAYKKFCNYAFIKK